MLSGCAGTPSSSAEVWESAGTPVSALSAAQAEPSAQEGLSAQESQLSSRKQSLSRADRERITSILALLARADRAILNNRLAKPRGDSASDYYHQVLNLQPGYEEALLGLDKIVDRYLQYRLAAQWQGNEERARHYLALARRADPGSEKVRQAGSESRPGTSASARYIPLDPQQLKSRSADLVVVLGPLGDRIKAADTRVTIEAPTDGQGRWVYQQLNKRHEEYRIRANLRLEKQPGVRLLD
ncbi:MAG: hypothetical protein ACJAWL_001309 [Motiliproteus sp.]|jgi:hypothetical protein